MIVAFAGFSQSTRSGAANGMTLNGSTGLIVVPDARVGWENTQIGLDIGYGFVWSGAGQFDHVPRFASEPVQATGSVRVLLRLMTIIWRTLYPRHQVSAF